MKRTLAVSLALFMLAGCGGGGGSGSVPASTQAQSQSKTAPGSVIISIPVASGTTQASSRNARFPQFVSPNASSVALSINGGADTIFDVSPTSSLCATVAGSRNCTLAFAAPAGSDSFAFLIFAGPNASGAQLASAGTTHAIVAGQAFNFTVALNAAIGTIVANVPNNSGSQGCTNQATTTSNTISEGCAGSSGVVTLVVFDPSGAQITGSAAYAGNGIQITANDPSLSATPNQITAPGQTTVLHYTGAAFAASITNSVTFNLTVGTQTIPVAVPVVRSYLYVAHTNAPFGTAPSCCGNITVYTFGASGATAPVRTISGGTSGITSPIKPLVDASGTLYVLDNNLPISAGIFNPTIRVFAPGANGNVAPIRQITGINIVSGNQACSDMVFDPTGNFLFVSCGVKVFVFPVSANTTATSSVVASFNGAASSANGLAFDPSGNLYVADQAANSIFINTGPLPTSGGFQTVNAGGSMDAPLAWSISVMPFFLAVDVGGTLYAPVWFQNATPGAADAQAELAIWKSGNICNNCNPSAFLTGSPFSTPATSHAVDGIALDAAGNVYVDNLFTNVVTEFSQATIAGASLGTTGAVMRTLNNAGVPGSAGMAIGP